jgi:hypothetical protein
MKRGIRISLCALLIAAVAGFAWWHTQRRGEAEDTAAALAAANDAMARLNAESARFSNEISNATASLARDVLLAPGRAAEKIRASILPRLDAYLATVDDAVRAANVYLARVPDEPTQRQVDRIRRRGEATRAYRDKLGEIARRIETGAPADEISAALMSASAALMVSDLAP